METLALFEDGSASRLIFASFETTPLDDPVRLAFPDIEDAQVRNSARNSCLAAYHLLNRQGYLQRRDRFFYSCQFADPKMNLMIQGSSAGLAFGLKLAQEAYRLRTGRSLAHSIAATGVVSDSSEEASVESVRGISAKLEAAVAVLAAGDQVFYPAANQPELSAALRAQAAHKGIQLVPVSSMAQALEVLFSSTGEGRNWNTMTRAAVATALVLPLAVGIYLFYESPAASDSAVLQQGGDSYHRVAQGRGLSHDTMLAARLQGRQGLSLAIDFHYLSLNKRGRVAVDIPPPPLALRYGDMFKLSCRASQPCYLQIYQIDSRGRVDRLPDPTPGAGVPLLKADTTYCLPAAVEDWRLVDAVEGQETLYFVASMQPDRELEETYRSFRLASEAHKQEFTRHLEEQLQERSNASGGFYASFTFQHLPNEERPATRRGPDLQILGREGPQILFASDRSGDDEIYMMNTEGVNLMCLTRDPATDHSPSWSPDGQRIAFASDRSGDEDIYVMNANGSGVQNLTHSPGRDTQPSWSPDGTQIAFQSNRGKADENDFDIYVMNADGHEVKPLAATSSREQHPVFSPDGQEIAYVYSTTFDDQQIFLMNADGEENRPLQPSLLPFNEVNPFWSPDGQRLAFTGFVPGMPTQIYLIDAQGTGRLDPVTSFAGSSCLGSFSPDGTRIVYYSQEKPAEASYALRQGDIRGNRQNVLIDHLISKLGPSWDQCFRNIGTARIGEQVERQMYVKNLGDDTLKVRQIRFGDGQFAAQPAQLEVLPEGIGSVALRFAPIREGTSYSELKVLSNDPDDPEIRLILNGRGQPAAIQAQGAETPVKVSALGGN